MPALPLHLVTGFLGSGKTTLLNELLRSPGFARTMVVVNEFGEVGLDHLLVSSAQDNVLLLESGCLCCAASGSLRDTLIDLFSRVAAGTLPAFDRVVVETSGLANPGPIVAGVLGDSALRGRCELAQVLTLVDAVNGESTLANYAEARRQVAFADRIVLTKTQLASPDRAGAIATLLRSLNPHADFSVASADVPAAQYFDAPLRSARPAAESWLRGPMKGQQAHDEAFRQIRTFSFDAPHPIGWPAYAAWCDQMRRRWGAKLLRCKGLLTLGDDGRQCVVQGVQGYFAPPVPYTGPPAAGFLVCIGEGLVREELAGLFPLPEPTTGTLP